MTEQFTPPKRIVLEDTGERRLPSDEPYIYLGTRIGPFHSIGTEPETLLERFDGGTCYDGWAGKPEDYAIYRIVEVQP